MTIDHISFKCRLNHEARLKKKKTQGFLGFQGFPNDILCGKKQNPTKKIVAKNNLLLRYLDS